MAYLLKGHHRLNGKELLGYARFRHDEEGDFGRVRRQQQVMQTLKKELVTPSSVIKLPKVAGILGAILIQVCQIQLSSKQVLVTV